MEDILVPAIVFGTITGTIVALAYLKNRRLERMALIAAGKEASLFNEGENKNRKSSSLKYGLLAIGVALGIIIGDILAQNDIMMPEVSYLSMIFLIGGASLLAYYFIQNKIDKKV